MTTSNNNQPKGAQLQLTTARTAVSATIPAKSTVVIGGVSYTQAQLVTYITTLLAPILAAQTAKQSFTAAVLARKQNQPTVQTFLVQLHAALIALFGRGSPVLAQFGFTPYKAKTSTSGKNVVKAAKSLASRVKLGTKGPKQKALILAQQPPAFTVSSDGSISLATTGDASSTAPATSAANPTAASTGSNGASGASNPGSPAGSTTTPSNS
jgi:hypothetical protein